VFFSLSQLADIKVLEDYLRDISSTVGGSKLLLLDSIDESNLDDENRKKLEELITSEISK